ncbi:Allantoicase [Smittium mucronatum]|uniref:Allantoicase n=1 Tax=Smittium mucronatum TaxID=133383 RepID=A0A1R0H2U3_9FUNG|nr:Allantoicase [Smittium mucronatum]
MGNSQSSYPLYYNVDVDSNDKINALSGFANLACSSLGASIISTSDEKFGSPKNLIKSEPPSLQNISPTGLTKGCTVIIKLGSTGTIAGFGIDSTHLFEDSAIKISIEACLVPEEIQAKYSHNHEEFPFIWDVVLPEAIVAPNTLTNLALWHETKSVYNFVKINIYPDGGLSRLSIYGTVVSLIESSSLVDLACVSNGGLVVNASDDTLGKKENLILPGFKKSEASYGWVTRRNLSTTPIENLSDWAIIKLGDAGYLQTAHLEVASLEGVLPNSFSISACFSTSIDPSADNDTHWFEIYSDSPLKPHIVNKVDLSLQDQIFTHVKLTIRPDGGICRLRIFGKRPSDTESSTEDIQPVSSNNETVVEVLELDIVKEPLSLDETIPTSPKGTERTRRRRKSFKESEQSTPKKEPIANTSETTENEPIPPLVDTDLKETVPDVAEPPTTPTKTADPELSTPRTDGRVIAKARKPSSKKPIFLHSPGDGLTIKQQPQTQTQTHPIPPISSILSPKHKVNSNSATSDDRDESIPLKKPKNDPSRSKHDTTNSNAPDETPKPNRPKKSKKSAKIVQ